MSSVTVDGIDNDTFPHNTARQITVNLAAVFACRTRFSGELRWQLFCPTEYLRHVFQSFTRLEDGPTMVGARALGALAMESMASRRLTHGDLQACLAFDATSPLPLADSETVRSIDGKIIGSTSTVAFGHTLGKSLAVARLKDCGSSLKELVFTGSVPTGQSILRATAETAVPCVMELGGQSPSIVFPDADMDLVVDNTIAGIFMNCGQVCDAMSRLIVHEDVYDEVVERVVAATRKLSIGPRFCRFHDSRALNRQ